MACSQATSWPFSQILRSGADGAPRVALLKLEPGFEMDAHTHAFAGNHFLLEGCAERLSK